MTDWTPDVVVTLTPEQVLGDVVVDVVVVLDGDDVVGLQGTVVSSTVGGWEVEYGPTGPSGVAGVAGPPGPVGPAGPAGGTFTHVQGVPAAVWTINHGLGFAPAVTVLDSTNRLVEGEVAFPDMNTLVLTFAAAFSGTAYLS